MGGPEAQPLVDYVLSRAPAAKLVLRDTSYLMYVTATADTASALLAIVGTGSYSFHMTAAGKFQDIAFSLPSDIQCAAKLRDALQGTSGLLQLSIFEPSPLLSVAKRLRLSPPDGSSGVRLSHDPKGPLLIDDMATYMEWTGLVSNALECPTHPRVLSLDTEFKGRMLHLVQVHVMHT